MKQISLYDYLAVETDYLNFKKRKDFEKSFSWIFIRCEKYKDNIVYRHLEYLKNYYGEEKPIFRLEDKSFLEEFKWEEKVFFGKEICYILYPYPKMLLYFGTKKLYEIVKEKYQKQIEEYFKSKEII